MGRTWTTLASDLGFAEGPVISPDGTIYVCSVTRGGIYRIEGDGRTTLVADTGGGCNGATFAADGSLYLAQNGGRKSKDGPTHTPADCGIQRLSPDGEVTWVTRDPVTPNDVRFGPDGLLYVTDPTRTPSMDDGRLWRVDVRSGAAELLVSVDWFPNGLAWSPDGRLFVADTLNAMIRVSEVIDGKVSRPRPLFELRNGAPDGIAFDAAGHLVVCGIRLDGGLGSIQTYTAGGDLLDEFSTGEGSFCTNIAFTENESLLVSYGDLETLVEVAEWGVGGRPLYTGPMT